MQHPTPNKPVSSPYLALPSTQRHLARRVIQAMFSLDHLHDLALLYLGLAHGADAELDMTEAHEIIAKLRRWQPDRDPALLSHVLREASLTYLNGHSPDDLEAVARGLGEALPPDLRREILEDLKDIARADGTVVPAESAFISHLRDLWEEA